MRSFSFDAKKTIKGKFKPSSKAERDFYSSLKKVAKASGHIVETHVHGAKLTDVNQMNKALAEYSKRLEPWAVRQAAKLVDQVAKSNKRAYQQKSKAIGRALSLGVAEDPLFDISIRLMREQVALIQSIPLEAGARAQDLALRAAIEGTRAFPDQSTIDEIQKQLGLSTEVATSRAQLIAITETARANASINQTRAMAVGSNQYRWHNSGDGAVRHSHKIYKGKKLQGMIFSWDAPPTLDDGMTGHPGTFPRCRCFAEPVFSDE